MTTRMLRSVILTRQCFISQCSRKWQEDYFFNHTAVTLDADKVKACGIGDCILKMIADMPRSPPYIPLKNKRNRTTLSCRNYDELFSHFDGGS